MTYRSPKCPPPFRPLRHPHSAQKRKADETGAHKATGTLLLGPGRMGLPAQGGARGEIQSQSERETGSHPREQTQESAKGQSEALRRRVKEPVDQKQDLNVGGSRIRTRFKTEPVSCARG